MNISKDKQRREIFAFLKCFSSCVFNITNNTFPFLKDKLSNINLIINIISVTFIAIISFENVFEAFTT